MAQIKIRENGNQFTAQCPDCSFNGNEDKTQHIITEVRETEGRQVPIPDASKAPARCQRCGCPMDPGKPARDFSNNRAKEADKAVAVGVIDVPVATAVDPDGDDDND